MGILWMASRECVEPWVHAEHCLHECKVLNDAQAEMTRACERIGSTFEAIDAQEVAKAIRVQHAMQQVAA